VYRADEVANTVLVHPSFKDYSKGYNCLGATRQISFCHFGEVMKSGEADVKSVTGKHHQHAAA